MPKSQRISTKVGIDKSLRVQLDQDFETLNILSLKILKSDIYSRQCSDYGVVVGRVSVNGGFGLPNAKVSIFIPLSEEDSNNEAITQIYPYESLSDVSEEGYRYNLLSREPSYDGHAATGTFPNREDVLLDQSYIEVYDKYYKLTTRTNDSGDYMIFGVPTGSQTVFMDVDLSDIGCFSLSPQDLIQAGQASESQVNGSRFKSSTNLNELPQVKTLNKVIEISPLWGEPEICELGITRTDFDLTAEANISINPTSVFMGSIISTTEDDALKTNCKPKNNTGNLCELVSGPGQILSIRQTVNIDSDGNPILEQFDLDNNGKVIDGNGTYLVNLPMNLDYITTNEFGEQVISTDPSVGIPTKAKYRFKFKWENEGGLQNEFLRANYLVPNIKEYGWNTSSYANDPLKTGVQQTISFTTPVGNTSTQIAFPNSGGLVFDEAINTSSYSVTINGQPYFGDTQVIDVSAGDVIEITPVFVDASTPSTINYTFYNEEYFNVLKSYSFSLDWDDYANPQSAIDCEDTFYEFNYNKVYTTAMFIDRYKNGIGRAKHLGIKEIDDRGCKSDVNTFPVNDIIRNFDFLFFAFNILLNLLTPIFLVVLFIAHLIALIWPVLKFVLIALGLYFVVQAGFAVYEIGTTIGNVANELSGLFSSGAGVVFNLTNLLEAIRLSLVIIVLVVKAIFIVGISIAFLAVAIIAALKIKNFPRIGLPMITYPDCSTCDCACNNAPLGDDFDESSVDSYINEVGSENAGVDNPPYGVPSSVSSQYSIFAPINRIGSYNITHPNLDQPLDDDDEPTRCYGNFWLYPPPPPSYPPFCPSSLQDPGYKKLQYRSFANQGANQTIGPQIGTPAGLGFVRLLAGSESLANWELDNGIPAPTELHAPQPFVLAPYRRDKDGSSSSDDDKQSKRYLAQPLTETHSQKLNEFNYRKKYFEGVNKIEVTFNEPEASNFGVSHSDQPLVILARPGTLQNLGIGEVISFQDTKLSNCNVNITGTTFGSITGGTENQFGTFGVTGTTQTGTTVFVNYANTTATNQTVEYYLTHNQGEETYLQYPIDIEYFQVITGYTYSDFTNIANMGVSQNFPYKYLNHKVYFYYANEFNNDGNIYDKNVFTLNDDDELTFKPIGSATHFTPNNDSDAVSITKMDSYEDFEVIILTRGVDPHSPKQTNKYDISTICNQAPGTVVVQGDYYLNIPIQGFSDTNNINGIRPKTHNTGTNLGDNKLYFEPYNFRLGETSNGINEFTGFTSTLPYYYSNIDEEGNYKPDDGAPNTSVFDLGQSGTIIQNRGQVLPNISLSSAPGQIPHYSDNLQNTYYYAGGSFTAKNINNVSTEMQGNAGGDVGLKGKYYSNNSNSFARHFVYSPAYYRFNTYQNNPVNFSVDQTPGQPQYLVMRSDRIPTSTFVEENYDETSYGLHQNNKFQAFKGGNAPSPSIGFAPDINQGQAVYDETEFVQSLTSTLSCENMVSVQCYESSNGTGITVNDNCEITSDIVKKGCYCLLNGKETDNPFFKTVYLIDGLYERDAQLLVEWKTRFLLTFATCRGVFAQTFQNNWLNGALYMFTFNKVAQFTLQQPDEPIYSYCRDTIMFNQITNSFFYRSSPWDGNNFIGVESPPNQNIPQALINTYPGYGYNEKRIQFPTTVMDLGPREQFISQICSDGNFNGYLVDQIRSTTYKDNSDIIQMGFISRILNTGFWQRLIPIGNPGGSSSEGKGIIQFFNSDRKGDRIDGDFAQALAINSQWRVTPYLNENYRNIDLFIGEDDNSDPRPLFGIFFSSSTEEYVYRTKLTPGIEYSSLGCGGVYTDFGYPNDQVVPHYKWKMEGPSSFIFGTEDNNWNTDYSSGGFYSNEYQNLNFEDINQYFTTGGDLDPGFITNFDANGNPVPENNSIPQITNGNPGDSILVGAPFYFYFGLNNGNTAVDKFIKLYIETTG